MMDSYFPFQVEFVNGALYGSPEQMYRISVDFDTPALISYKTLFDRYKTTNGQFSLVEVASLIIQANALNLLDHLDFDEEGYLLDTHADSAEAVQEFTAAVCPAFRDREQLERYIQKIAYQ